MLQLYRRHRYLIYQLVARDIKSRYLGSVVGVFWSVLNPLLQLALYTMVFSVVLGARFGREQTTAQFAEMLFCGLLPWMAIQEAVTRSAGGFLEHSNLIKKVRFPLVSIPLSLTLSSLVHQLVGTVVFFVVIASTGSLQLTWLLLLPVIFALQFCFMLGAGSIAACLNVFFRDLVQILGVVFMLFFWLTPIVYSKDRVGEGILLWALNLNPLTHLVEAYRFIFFGTPTPEMTGLLYWLAVSLVLFVLGRRVLNRTRQTLVDLV